MLPASARSYFGGVDSVGGDVRYWAEPQDDGSGYSVITEGLAPVIAKVMAAANRFPAAPDFATISWTPNTPGFVLQETASLAPAVWTNSPSGATNPVTVPATLPAKFYRLTKP